MVGGEDERMQAAASKEHGGCRFVRVLWPARKSRSRAIGRLFVLGEVPDAKRPERQAPRGSPRADTSDYACA